MRYLLSFFTLCLLACTGIKNSAQVNATSGSIQGTKWVISSIPNVTLSPTDRPVDLSFSDTSTRFGGYSGCNMYGGVFKVVGNKITFSEVLGTQRACLSGMEVEQAIYKVLSATNNYQIVAGKLQLRQGDQVLAEWKKEEKE